MGSRVPSEKVYDEFDSLIDVCVDYGYPELAEKLRKMRDDIPEVTNDIMAAMVRKELAEKGLQKLLEKLPNTGGECSCDLDERQTVKMIHEGEFPEIIETCLRCGGTVV